MGRWGRRMENSFGERNGSKERKADRCLGGPALYADCCLLVAIYRDWGHGSGIGQTSPLLHSVCPLRRRLHAGGIHAVTVGALGRKVLSQGRWSKFGAPSGQDLASRRRLVCARAVW